MRDQMFKPANWVSISLQADRFFVHVSEGGRRSTLGPFASNHEAASRAKAEAARLGLNDGNAALSPRLSAA